jgi:hypothetical protein
VLFLALMGSAMFSLFCLVVIAAAISSTTYSTYLAFLGSVFFFVSRTPLLHAFKRHLLFIYFFLVFVQSRRSFSFALLCRDTLLMLHDGLEHGLFNGTSRLLLLYIWAVLKLEKRKKTYYSFVHSNFALFLSL